MNWALEIVLKPLQNIQARILHYLQLHFLENIVNSSDIFQISSSIHQFASLRKDALRDQEYLAREAHYLQSIALPLTWKI